MRIACQAVPRGLISIIRPASNGPQYSKVKRHLAQSKKTKSWRAWLGSTRNSPAAPGEKRQGRVIRCGNQGRRRGMRTSAAPSQGRASSVPRSSLLHLFASLGVGRCFCFGVMWCVKCCVDGG
jgi:hypothetical protein